MFSAESMTRSSAAKRKARAARGELDALADGRDSFEAEDFDPGSDLFDELDELDEADEAEDFEHLDEFERHEHHRYHDGLAGEAEDHEAPFVDADEGDDDEHYPELAPEQQEALRSELQNRLDAYLSRGRARVVITDNLRTMMSIKRGHGVYSFRLHHMFVDAPPVILRAVAAYAERQDREASDLLRDFIDANEDAIRQRSAPRPFTVDVEGRSHNLQAIFDELNATYFGGAIRARITWGPRGKRKRGRSSIKLGSYTVEDELIRVHPVLDAQDVPRYYIAWVVYHEMLHEIHDMPIVDGRRVYHTRAFRQAEAKFEQYAEAVLWERTNLHKLLDR